MRSRGSEPVRGCSDPWVCPEVRLNDEEPPMSGIVDSASAVLGSWAKCPLRRQPGVDFRPGEGLYRLG